MWLSTLSLCDPDCNLLYGVYSCSLASSGVAGLIIDGSGRKDSSFKISTLTWINNETVAWFYQHPQTKFLLVSFFQCPFPALKPHSWPISPTYFLYHSSFAFTYSPLIFDLFLYLFPPLLFFTHLSPMAVWLFLIFVIFLSDTPLCSLTLLPSGQKQNTQNVCAAAWWTPIVTVEMSRVACCCYLVADLSFHTWCWMKNKISFREVWALQRQVLGLLHLRIFM